jgi:alpha-D-ribose 1-methylphosphonate 5-triphosphate synthase subunit PhnH
MLAIPSPDEAEFRDNATFEAILWAFARPGERRRLPVSGSLAVGLALVDRECRVYAKDPALEEALRQTGATMVSLEAADHAFLPIDNSEALTRLADISAGDPLYPDLGATVVVPARIGDGPELRLSGPGIETETRIRLGGVHRGLWPLRARLCAYPLGVEFIFVDGAEIVAIPRSTLIEEI